MFDIFDLLTITWRFFQSFDHQSGSRWNDVYLCLTILSPIFLGDKPSGPTLGAKAEVAATSPPTAFRTTTLISLGSNLGGILNRCFSFYKLWRKKHVNLMAKWWMRTIISIEICPDHKKLHLPFVENK